MCVDKLNKESGYCYNNYWSLNNLDDLQMYCLFFCNVEHSVYESQWYFGRAVNIEFFRTRISKFLNSLVGNFFIYYSGFFYKIEVTWKVFFEGNQEKRLLEAK